MRWFFPKANYRFMNEVSVGPEMVLVLEVTSVGVYEKSGSCLSTDMEG